MNPSEGHGWLDLLDRIVSAQWPLTTFVMVLFVIVSALLYYATRRTRTQLHARHQICEWKLMRVTQAMMLYIKQHEGNGTKPNQKRRATDKLVGEMLEAALKGPQSDADRAEVAGMTV